MIEELLKADPQFETILEQPIAFEDTLEAQAYASRPAGPGAAAQFVKEFDEDMGHWVSKLVDWKQHNQRVVADSVREVLGLPRTAMSEEDAVKTALDPARNAYFGEAMTLTTLSKVTRSLVHASYTFKKR